jgi:nucleoside-diphosphate-sugar epimerase
MGARQRVGGRSNTRFRLVSRGRPTGTAERVPDLHIRAMTHPEANGERFLCCAGELVSMLDIASILRARVGEAARRVPRRELPDWLVRLAARFVPAMKQAVPELGKVKRASNEKARRVLGWTPRSNEEALVATAESLLRLGLVTGARHPIS